MIDMSSSQILVHISQPTASEMLHVFQRANFGAGMGEQKGNTGICGSQDQLDHISRLRLSGSSSDPQLHYAPVLKIKVLLQISKILDVYKKN